MDKYGFKIRTTNTEEMQRLTKKSIILYVLCQMLGVPSAIYTFVKIFITENYDQILATTLEGILLSGIFLGLYFFYQYKDILKEDFQKLKKQTDRILPTIVIYLGLLSANALTTTFIYKGTPDNQMAIMQGMEGINPIIFILGVSIFVPFVEEIIFRHTIIKVFGNSKGRKYSYPLSIILFTLAHSLVNPIAFIVYLPMSLFFTFVYWWYKENLVVVSFVHIFNNFLSASAIFVMLNQGLM